MEETPIAGTDQAQEEDGEELQKSADNAEEDASEEAREQKSAEEQPERVQKPMPRTRGRLGGGARPPRTAKKPVQSKVNREALEGLKRRMEEDARRLRGESAEEQQAVDVLARPEADAVRSRSSELESKAASPSPTRAPATVQRAAPGSVARQPQSALKVQSTPGVENSILALANFRRRPRQPSLLQMVQGKTADVTDEDTTDFTLGTDLDDSAEGLEGFKPYDESTPVQLSKTQASQYAQHAQPAEDLTTRENVGVDVGAEEDDADDLYGATPLGTPSRKRKSDAMSDASDTQVQVRRSAPPSPQRRSSSSLSQVPADDFLTVPATAPESDEHDDQDQEPQDLLSDTFADPVSSSPPPMLSPQRRHDQETRLSSSPQQRKTVRSGTIDKSKQKPLTTATLRALLPKRRTRRSREDRDDFDIPTSSSIDQRSSEDEPTRRRPAAKKGATARVKHAKGTKGADRSRAGALSPIAARKTKKQAPAATATTATATAAKQKKTYARISNVSDKENAAIAIDDSSSPLSSAISMSAGGGGDDDDNGQDSESADTSLSTIVVGGGGRRGKNGGGGVSLELAAAKSKFADIDAWEMEFESASLGVGAESSPWR